MLFADEIKEYLQNQRIAYLTRWKTVVIYYLHLRYQIMLTPPFVDLCYLLALL